MKKPKAQDSFALDKLAAHLRSMFGDLIDMNDWAARDPAAQDQAFLSRALAAFCVQHMAKTDAKIAAAAVVDEGSDNGIDAVHYDPSGILYVVQSKWRQPEGGFKLPDVQRFAGGLRDLLIPDFEKFGEKLRAKEQLINRVLWDVDTLTTAVTVHTGTQPLAKPASDPLDDWLASMNDDEVKTGSVVNMTFKDVWDMLKSGSTPASIDLDVYLRDWGMTKGPYKAYYGRVDASEISGWWRKHGGLLCARNLRHFSPALEVNTAIGETLQKHPKHFWYLNNGITIVCTSAKVAPIGGGERGVGSFKCKNSSIVNGAQTYGMIGSVANPAPEDPSDRDMDANGDTPWVQVRIIATGGADAFESQITQATNFQNKVQPRDLAGMDPIHNRLAVEFSLDRRRYSFKSNETDPAGEEGCSLTEATQALGCATNSVADAVLVRRNPGLVWMNRNSPPYSVSFNKNTTAAMVWNAVQIMRTVNGVLHELSGSSIPRADLIAVHLNRLVLHMVFQDPRLQAFRDHKSDLEYLKRVAVADTKVVFAKLAVETHKRHPQAYLAVLAKNTSKCRDLVDSIAWEPPHVAASATQEPKVDSRHTPSLFSEANT